MFLRELKKETHALPPLKEQTEPFISSCIAPLKLLLKELSHQQHQELGRKYQDLKSTVEQLAFFQSIHDKLQYQSRQLIELKLAEFTQDKAKTKFITHRLLKDEFFNIPQTLMDIRMFNEHLKSLQEKYQELHQELHKSLSLEHHVQLLHLPYRQQLAGFSLLQKQQQSLAKNIGKEFVKMVKGKDK